MFRLAVAEAGRPKNPAEELFIPRKAVRSVRRLMSPEVVKNCLEVLERRESIIIRLAVLVGMRPGELFALTCGQIGRIPAKIEQRVYRGKIDSPKIIHSIRDAALPMRLTTDLKSWVADLSDHSAAAWDFPSETLETPLLSDNAWR